MLDNHFQFAILATEDRIRDLRLRRSAAESGTKRIFRLGGERNSARQTGRR
jgi:hypothetical protein